MTKYIKQKAVAPHYSMSPRLEKLINKYARKTGRNKSEFVREAVRRYMKYIRGGGL